MIVIQYFKMQKRTAGSPVKESKDNVIIVELEVCAVGRVGKINETDAMVHSGERSIMNVFSNQEQVILQTFYQHYLFLEIKLDIGNWYNYIMCVFLFRLE